MTDLIPEDGVTRYRVTNLQENPAEGTNARHYTKASTSGGTGTKFLISKFLITKFLITKFLITKFLSNKVPK